MEKSNDQSSQTKNPVLTHEIDKNIDMIKSIFKDDQTLIIRQLENRLDSSTKYCVVYIDGMVNNKLLNEDVIKPLLECRLRWKDRDLIDIIAKQVMLSDDVQRTTDTETMLQGIVYGDTVLLIDGYAEVLILNTKGWASRSISEPDSEKVLRGPREGFNEAIMMNLSLVRRKLRTPDLKMEFQVFGTRTKTKGCICYLDGIVNKEVLKEFKKRLKKFTIDGTLDSNYIAEFIKDAPYSPIKTVGSTEKPDIVAAKLLEGRVALFLDGTPVVLTAPCFFIENFQSNEDYYLNFYFASINRMLRLFAFFIATSLPALYVSLTTFHQEMLPTPLLMSISLARQGVPFPTALEAFLMLIVFEMLRESGSRMPGSMGQALSIVGALVIGQASVTAKIVSAPMVIIIGFTGISGLMIPRIKGADVMLRFIFLGLSTMLGLYGYMFGILGFLIHLFNLSSFGVPIMTGTFANSLQDRKDIFVRAPWWFMKKRPKYLSPNKTRESTKGGTQ